MAVLDAIPLAGTGMAALLGVEHAGGPRASRPKLVTAEDSSLECSKARGLDRHRARVEAGGGTLRGPRGPTWALDLVEDDTVDSDATNGLIDLLDQEEGPEVREAARS